ncbi:Phosphate ABC transporter, periplasmic phosphate-binding protein PstS [Enhygromyxa salina]|uniref:Phosphate ABC transporter, periplasmic phosphate-binding protein PstS n=2 Tax=Enhygromyxa salina TaxID=215803 RepID=A0A0C1ZRJ3_9BACT|nr:Phosphate ABC transporter, periplasmic phosphate-binding protein PstS [Enhygromyxa salina]
MSPERADGSRRARIVGWSLALIGSALLLLTGWLLVRLVESGPLPPFLDETIPPPAKAQAAPKPSNLLRLAGSGSNLPLTRELAAVYVSKRPWLRVRVHESIGSSGGVRATLERAIEVGLISRGLQPAEQAQGVVSIPYARVAVVLAANPSVPVRGVTREDLLDLYAGRREYWADGSPVVLLKREPGDSSHLAVYAAVPELEAVDAEAWTADRGRRLFHDRAMQEALISTPGAVGLFDQGLATIQSLPIVVLEFEGHRPNEDAVRSGSYPIYKDLSFVIPAEEPDPLAHEFISFVFSAEGQRVIRESGYVPLEPPARSSFAHLHAGPGPEQLDTPTPAAGDDTSDDGTSSEDQ